MTRDALREDGVATLIDAAVVELLATGPDAPAEDDAEFQSRSSELMDALSEAERKGQGAPTQGKAPQVQEDSGETDGARAAEISDRQP